MKRFTKVITSTIFLSVSAVSPAHGQTGDPSPIEWFNPFSWYFEAQPDWVTGIFFAVLGLVGAAAVVYTSIGGAIPGTAGSATIKRRMKMVEDLEKRLLELGQSSQPNQAAIDALTDILAEVRKPLSGDKLLNYTLAGGLYLLLGAFFSSMLAQDLFQALAIGAGWTSLLGAVGLKGEFQRLATEREQAGNDLRTLLEPKFQAGNWTPVEAEKVRHLIRSTTV